MNFKKICDEPFRLFFPLGTLFLIWGVLLWVPQIWNPGDYPVLAHRYLMLNGFTASFIGGFLMTAVPRFSKTFFAQTPEVLIYAGLTLLGLVLAFNDKEQFVFCASALQAAFLLIFLFRRIFKRKENPPYSFVFIFVGLILWMLSGFLSVNVDMESFKNLHYEGAIAAIILGVGGRLIPGILGHVEIVSAQRERYERPVSILSTVPLHFMLMVAIFVVSYFLPESWGPILRAIIVGIIALVYWRLWSAPREKTALTWSIWVTGWMILLSFLLKASWQDGVIHASHSFFISGVVLLSLLIGTRVLQSHGPKDKSLENIKILYVVCFFVILSAATRVTAFLMPEAYLRHLGYSSIVLVLGVLIWAVKYLRYAFR